MGSHICFCILSVVIFGVVELYGENQPQLSWKRENLYNSLKISQKPQEFSDIVALSQPSLILKTHSLLVKYILWIVAIGKCDFEPHYICVSVITSPAILACQCSVKCGLVTVSPDCQHIQLWGWHWFRGVDKFFFMFSFLLENIMVNTFVVFNLIFSYLIAVLFVWWSPWKKEAHPKLLGKLHFFLTQGKVNFKGSKLL